MYTECPNCHTVFRITAEQLDAAGGKVRCGTCQTVFDAREKLSDQIPLEAESPPQPPPATGATEATGKEPDLELDLAEDLDNLRAEPAQEALDLAADDFSLAVEASAETEAEATATTPLESLSQLEPLEETGKSARDEAPTTTVELDPDEYIKEELAATEPRRSRLGTVLWSLGIVVLLLVLAGQYLYFNRAKLAQHDALRPALAAVCGVVGLLKPCEIPERRDLDAIVLLEREVRSHPERKGALLITAKLANQADFTQPFPKLELRFYDINRKLLAWRAFEPDEYLENVSNIDQGMPPGEAVAARLEIVDPGPEAVNFEFNFR